MPVTIDLYTLSLHDALPISVCQKVAEKPQPCVHREPCGGEHLLNGCAALRLSMGSDFGEFEERLLHALPNSVFAVPNIPPEDIFGASQVVRVVPTIGAMAFRDV